jgi:hypothetical protein
MEPEILDNEQGAVQSTKDSILGIMGIIQNELQKRMEHGDSHVEQRELKFMAATAYGMDPTAAAEMAGYEAPEVSGKILMKQQHIKEGVQVVLESKGLTVDYLCNKVKDLCEASDVGKSGVPRPNWRARSSGLEHLTRLHGLHKTTTIRAELSFEERLARLDVGIETEE